ncbi:hypothetical protein [Bartonella phoceensis]|nr:hypothetical protein [Bartonella phoceensis]
MRFISYGENSTALGLGLGAALYGYRRCPRFGGYGLVRLCGGLL